MKAMIFVCFTGVNSDLKILEALFDNCIKNKIKLETHNEAAMPEFMLYNSGGDLVLYMDVETTNSNMLELTTYFNELFSNILTNLNLFSVVRYRVGVVM